MNVSDAMTDYFASAYINSTVADAMEKMLEEGLNTLLIVDDRSRLVGCIEESLLMVAAFDEKWRMDPVSLHMKRDLVTLSPDEPLVEAVEKFLVHRASQFPVISSEKLAGVLTRRQLLRAITGQSDRKIKRFAIPSVA